MKKVLGVIVLAFVVLSLSRMSAGQAGAASPREQPSRADQLLDAAGKGDVAAVKLLLGKGVSIDARNEDGTTALKLAGNAGKTDAAALLRERGAK